MNTRRAVSLIVAAALVVVGGLFAADAGENSVRAKMSWHNRVRLFVTGPQQVFVYGPLSGQFRVESGARALEGASVVCPAAVDVDYEAKVEHGEGRCIITVAGGDRVFARWRCDGEPDRDCTGRFVLTGGTGAFQGVTGEGAVVFRMVVADIVQFALQEAEYEISGVATWPALTYRTP